MYSSQLSCPIFLSHCGTRDSEHEKKFKTPKKDQNFTFLSSKKCSNATRSMI